MSPLLPLSEKLWTKIGTAPSVEGALDKAVTSGFPGAAAALGCRGAALQKMEPTQITVRACKYDGSEHRRWPATIVRQEGSLLILDARFDEEIQHDLLGTIALGTTSIEYYWLDRWYNVFRFADPCGALRNYYCNINVPPTFDGQLLSYVDLDTDILVEADFSYRVLDLEEFEQNAARYGYSRELRLNAERALGELITLIESRAFPFNE